MAMSSAGATELANRLKAIADELRGRTNMEGFKFKDYILGVIFYRFLSERTEEFMNDLLKQDNISYEDALAEDGEFADTVRQWSIDYLGYIIEPNELFRAMIPKIKAEKFDAEDFQKAINHLVASTTDPKYHDNNDDADSVKNLSAPVFADMFSNVRMDDTELGTTVADRTSIMNDMILKISDIPFKADASGIDVLGTAYMILITMFASDAGKKAGEFFTPASAAKLVARIAAAGMKSANNICDPTAGSASLLLQVLGELEDHEVGNFYTQEKIASSYNIARMNFLIHGVEYQKIHCFKADTLLEDKLVDEDGKPILFDITVANPPYSLDYKQTTALKEDPRFKGPGVLPPKSFADLLFLQHMAYHMAEHGKVAVLLSQGSMTRGKKEQKIREYMIERLNCIDTIIGLPDKMFYGTGIAVDLVILKRNRNGDSDNIFFMDASKLFVKEGKFNILTDDAIDEIVDAYMKREDIPKFTQKVPLTTIKDDGYILNVPRYVDTTVEEAEIDIPAQLKALEELDYKAAEASKIVYKYFKALGLK
ncbi:MAG: type I restriction-modification system subunit M [Lachnospiraceae bacterium]|nr:type I restriction-modification system subunit M [Lachnospiraceae bacterium]